MSIIHGISCILPRGLIDVLVQEKRNSSASVIKLRLSCINRPNMTAECDFIPKTDNISCWIIYGVCIADTLLFTFDIFHVIYPEGLENN